MDLNHLKQREWDVAVIGAGPAGSIAAYVLAQKGFSVLLIDKETFPRSKVCGACINGKTLTLFDDLGLKDKLLSLKPHPLTEFRLAHQDQEIRLPLQEGWVLSREQLDHQLILQACAAGAHFADETHAFIEPASQDEVGIQLEQKNLSVRAQARIALIADGLGGNSLQHLKGYQPVVAKKSRLGLGILAEEGPAFYEPGVIYMAVDKRGYAGVVRLEDGRLNLAAALDPALLREPETKIPSEAVNYILKSAGFPPFPELGKGTCRGTPLLTRRRHALAGHRFFILGDAAGYIEPFTGEGIEWAVTTGRAVATLAEEGLQHWNTSLVNRWHQTHRVLVGRHQFLCRLIALGLRKTFLMRLGMHLLSKNLPWASLLVSRIQGAPA